MCTTKGQRGKLSRLSVAPGGALVDDTIGALGDAAQLLVLLHTAAGVEHADVALGGTRIRLPLRAGADSFLQLRSCRRRRRRRFCLCFSLCERVTLWGLGIMLFSHLVNLNLRPLTLKTSGLREVSAV